MKNTVLSCLLRRLILKGIQVKTGTAIKALTIENDQVTVKYQGVGMLRIMWIRCWLVSAENPRSQG